MRSVVAIYYLENNVVLPSSSRVEIFTQDCGMQGNCLFWKLTLGSSGNMVNNMKLSRLRNHVMTLNHGSPLVIWRVLETLTYDPGGIPDSKFSFASILWSRMVSSVIFIWWTKIQFGHLLFITYQCNNILKLNLDCF